MPKRVLTDSQIVTIHSLIQEGQRYTHLAAEYGVNIGTVSNIAKGVKRLSLAPLPKRESRFSGPAEPSLDAKAMARLRDARADGVSLADLADRFGIAPETVTKFCKDVQPLEWWT